MTFVACFSWNTVNPAFCFSIEDDKAFYLTTCVSCKSNQASFLSVAFNGNSVRAKVKTASPFPDFVEQQPVYFSI